MIFTVELIALFYCFSNIFNKLNASDSKDLICKNFDRKSRIDGITELKDGTRLIFRSSSLWQLNSRRGSCLHFNISDYFSDDLLTDGIDAITYHTRSETTFLFRGRYFWMIDNKKQMMAPMTSMFDDHLRDGIDAALTVDNPLYDGFGEFDYIYIFKGRKIWLFELYLFSDELHIFHQRRRIINMTQISSKLPERIDSAFSDGQSVYLFRDSFQYRLVARKFPKRIAENEVFVEQLLTGIIEGVVPMVIEGKSQSFSDLLLFYSLFWTKLMIESSNNLKTYSQMWRFSGIVKLFATSLIVSVIICVVFIFLKLARLYFPKIRFKISK